MWAREPQQPTPKSCRVLTLGWGPASGPPVCRDRIPAGSESILLTDPTPCRAPGGPQPAPGLPWVTPEKPGGGSDHPRCRFHLLPPQACLSPPVDPSTRQQGATHGCEQVTLCDLGQVPLFPWACLLLTMGSVRPGQSVRQAGICPTPALVQALPSLATTLGSYLHFTGMETDAQTGHCFGSQPHQERPGGVGVSGQATPPVRSMCPPHMRTWQGRQGDVRYQRGFPRRVQPEAWLQVVLSPTHRAHRPRPVPPLSPPSPPKGQTLQGLWLHVLKQLDLISLRTPVSCQVCLKLMA